MEQPISNFSAQSGVAEHYAAKNTAALGKLYSSFKDLETSSRHPVPHVHCASPNSGEFTRMLPLLNEMCALFNVGKIIEYSDFLKLF